MPRLRRKSSGNWSVLLIIGSFAVGLIALLHVASGTRFTKVTGDSVIAIHTQDLKPGSVEFYSYRDRAGTELRFLLARDSGGVLHAAMDACQRCYTYHQGYLTADGYLVCKFCGNRYKLAEMSHGLASCVPVKLPFKADGQTAKIDIAALRHGRYLFYGATHQ